MGPSRRELMEREVERLRSEAIALDRDWRRVPYLLAFGLLAVPAYYVWGPAAAMYAVLCAPCLVFVALYLLGVRRTENVQALRELEDQLSRMD